MPDRLSCTVTTAALLLAAYLSNPAGAGVPSVGSTKWTTDRGRTWHTGEYSSPSWGSTSRGRASASRPEPLALRPDYALVTASDFNNQGASYGMRGEPEKAIPYVRRALELDPGQTAALHNMGRYLLWAGSRAWSGRRWRDAVAYYQEILDWDLPNKQYHPGHRPDFRYVARHLNFLRGQVALLDGRWQEAERRFLEVRSESPRFHRIGEALAYAANEEGRSAYGERRFRDALSDFQRAADYDSKDPAVRNNVRIAGDLVRRNTGARIARTAIERLREEFESGRFSFDSPGERGTAPRDGWSEALAAARARARRPAGGEGQPAVPPVTDGSVVDVRDLTGKLRPAEPAAAAPRPARSLLSLFNSREFEEHMLGAMLAELEDDRRAATEAAARLAAWSRSILEDVQESPSGEKSLWDRYRERQAETDRDQARWVQAQERILDRRAKAFEESCRRAAKEIAGETRRLEKEGLFSERSDVKYGAWVNDSASRVNTRLANELRAADERAMQELRKEYARFQSERAKQVGK